MPVPLLDLKAQNLALESELKEAFDRVLRSGHYILGPEVDEFEKEIAARIGVKHAIGVSSGTDAILLALMALGIGPEDEVICPSFTFFATAGCIARAGATPVFADSCPTCFNIDPQDVAKRITKKTKAIIPVHLFGQAADMAPILAIAKEHNLFVIEDAAQALGAHYSGKQVGTFGEFAAFSFFPSKNLGALGDAGLLVANNDALAEKARLLRTHGAKPKYYHKLVGGNFRIDALQAALLRVKLPHYQKYTQNRQKNAALYSEKLAKITGVSLPSQMPSTECRPQVAQGGAEGDQLLLPSAHQGRGHIWNQYTLRVKGSGRRDALRNHLNSRKIGNEVYYPVAMHHQECFAYCGKTSLPVAEEASQEVISIPIYPELEVRQLDETINALEAFLG